ncbi:MAG: hypothetical protein B9S32_02470 [Verrucomicrobia bacterium Tous-C9LFEB]|nr:MAG: hypothetical protein B9S32_02470 [Verrucomicrobia bacterium Tous-C9LFEB]
MKVMRPMWMGVVLAVCGFFIFSSFAPAKDDGQMLALSQDLPGKNNVGGKGSEFAPELYNRFIKAGGEAHLVTFQWRREFEKAEQARTSSVVVFLDAEGRYWGMDMYSKQPVWVPGREPQKWLDRLYPNLITKLTTVRTESKLAGKYADLSRVANATPATPETPAPAAQPSARVTESQGTPVAAQ